VIVDDDIRQHTNVAVQAAHIERTLPEIARRLFTPDDEASGHSPLAELPNAQLKVCYLLADGRRTVSQVAEGLNISASAVTQIADRLEKAALVERVAPERGDGSDRRARYLALTRYGADLMSARRRWRAERVERALSHLSERERAAILAALESLLDAARRL
jgi:DNA-binding MarR family transcriptional regulator